MICRVLTNNNVYNIPWSPNPTRIIRLGILSQWLCLPFGLSLGNLCHCHWTPPQTQESLPSMNLCPQCGYSASNFKWHLYKMVMWWNLTAKSQCQLCKGNLCLDAPSTSTNLPLSTQSFSANVFQGFAMTQNPRTSYHLQTPIRVHMGQPQRSKSQGDEGTNPIHHYDDDLVWRAITVVDTLEFQKRFYGACIDEETSSFWLTSANKSLMFCRCQGNHAI